MSHEDFAIDRLSQRLPSLLPEYLKNESPMFEAFLKAYFEYLEAEILTLSSQSDIDGVLFEDSTGSMLLESATVAPSPDQDTSKIVSESSEGNILGNKAVSDPFKVGEYVVGSKSKTVAKINVINGNTFYCQTISGTGFAKGETVTGREGGQTGVCATFKENTILANNRLLDYSDIDHTTEEFLDYFQTDLAPSFDLGLTMNKRLTIKNIKDLYQQKGTEDSLKFLMRLIYGQDAEVRYPYNETIFPSESNYSQKRRVNIKMTKIGTVPVATDKVIQYTNAQKIGIVAESIIESVFVTDVDADEYSLEITDNHKGTFTQGGAVDLVDRDGITIESATIQGLVHSINTNSSSTYLSVNSEDGAMVLEDGSLVLQEDGSSLLQEAVEFDLLLEDGGGMLLENSDAGSMYTLSDKINFTGAKDDTDTTEAVTSVSGLSLGEVRKIYIDVGGTNYEGGEMVVFDNANTGGSGADGVLGSVGDEVIQENHETFGQYEFIATAGQTLFNGNDIHGKTLFFNDNHIEVFVNGILRTPDTPYTTNFFSHKNDRVVMTAGLSAGDVVEIVIEYYRMVYEDGRVINYSTTDGRIREVLITDGGAGYHTLPKVYPGGYIFVKDTSGFEAGEGISGGTSNATAKILRIEADKNRLVVLRDSTHVGVFANGEVITGGTTAQTEKILNNNVATGTGAKLFAYSSNIGSIDRLNILDQGNRFNSDALASTTSTFPMLITAPTGALNGEIVFTGDVSGATAKVKSYDQDRHVLKYYNLDGSFLENERVSFNNVDSFKILVDSPYNGRGSFGGEGVIQEQFLGDKSWLDTTAANIHDSHKYQSHSYIVKVGESINKWRSVVKDLLHPAGHIFFGEVAIKSVSDASSDNAISMVPMIVMQMVPTDNFLLETSHRDGQDHFCLEDGLAPDHDLYSQTSIHKLENEESRDNFAHFSKETKRVIQMYQSDNIVLETKVDGRLYEDHHMCLENGFPPGHAKYTTFGADKITTELARPESKVGDERFIPAARINEPLVFYKDAGQPVADGVLGATSEYFHSRLKSRHMNITKIVSKAAPLTRKTTRTDTNPKHAHVFVTAVSGQFVTNLGARTGIIELQQGYKYYFTTPKAHPLKFSTTEDGTHNGGTPYTTGVINYTHNNSADLYNMTWLSVDGSTPQTLYYYCTSHANMGGKTAKILPTFDSVLSLYPTDAYAPWVEISGIGGNLNSTVYDQSTPPNLIPLPTRLSSSGKVQTSFYGNDEELILEDGSKLVQEHVIDIMRLEPTHAQNTAAEEGDIMVYENGDRMELEEITTSQENEYFISERSNSLENTAVFNSFGTSLRRLNILSSQQTYDISYYLKDEANDDIVLENGTGTMMMETPKYEGLRMSDIETYFPLRYSDEFEKSFANKRTNITYSAYVKSG